MDDKKPTPAAPQEDSSDDEIDIDAVLAPKPSHRTTGMVDTVVRHFCAHLCARLSFRPVILTYSLLSFFYGQSEWHIG